MSLVRCEERGRTDGDSGFPEGVTRDKAPHPQRERPPASVATTWTGTLIEAPADACLTPNRPRSGGITTSSRSTEHIIALASRSVNRRSRCTENRSAPRLRGSAAQFRRLPRRRHLGCPLRLPGESTSTSLPTADLLTSEFCDLALDRAAELREDRGQGADADVGDSPSDRALVGKEQTTAVAGALFRFGASSRRTSVVAMRLFSCPFAAVGAVRKATLRTAAATR